MTKIELLEEVKLRLSSGKGICQTVETILKESDFITEEFKALMNRFTPTTLTLMFIPELYEHMPSEILTNDYWWSKYDIQSRVDAIDKTISKLDHTMFVLPDFRFDSPIEKYGDYITVYEVIQRAIQSVVRSHETSFYIGMCMALANSLYVCNVITYPKYNLPVRYTLTEYFEKFYTLKPKDCGAYWYDTKHLKSRIQCLLKLQELYKYKAFKTLIQ